MTMKSLLSTVSLALLIGSASATAQAQIAIGHLQDLSGGTADVGTVSTPDTSATWISTAAPCPAGNGPTPAGSAIVTG